MIFISDKLCLAFSLPDRASQGTISGGSPVISWSDPAPTTPGVRGSNPGLRQAWWWTWSPTQYYELFKKKIIVFSLDSLNRKPHQNAKKYKRKSGKS